MFSYYNKFLRESENNDIYAAEKISKTKELSDILNGCEEGKFPQIHVSVTSGADSYVGIAFNDGSPFSELYKTTDPKVALTAIVMKNIGKTDPDYIISVLKETSDFLTYSVFPGNRKMSPAEISKMFNFDLKVSPGDAIPFYTSTPISGKTY